eukprot:8177140-Pyramimonas_sp.AAC.1
MVHGGSSQPLPRWAHVLISSSVQTKNNCKFAVNWDARSSVVSSSRSVLATVSSWAVSAARSRWPGSASSASPRRPSDPEDRVERAEHQRSGPRQGCLGCPYPASLPRSGRF